MNAAPWLLIRARANLSKLRTSAGLLRVNMRPRFTYFPAFTLSRRRCKVGCVAPIKTLVVDDRPLVRERLRSMLATADDIEVAGETGGGTQAVRLLAEVLYCRHQRAGLGGR